MGVICFSSLKGGVGKTSVSLNLAHALARRGCETLLIDLDPAHHASRFFISDKADTKEFSSPFSQLFKIPNIEKLVKEQDSVLEIAIAANIPMVTDLRDCLALVPGSSGLRDFLFDPQARIFKDLFPQFIQELSDNYDYIVIDTPPDFNPLTEGAILASELVVVPVDSSAMSISSLEDLVANTAHIKNTTWTILRTMVNRQAARIQRLAQSRLQESIAMNVEKEDSVEDVFNDDIEDVENFIALIEKNEAKAPAQKTEAPKKAENESPIFLLDSLIYRTEQQNRISFLQKTAFDTKSTQKLAEQYSGLAKEVERVLALSGKTEPEIIAGDFLQAAAARM